jgi:ribosomal protein S30
MMTKFKSVSAQTPKLVGKNLAKVKGGDIWPQHGCLTQEAQ